MKHLLKFNESKSNFVKLNILDKILNSVKYLLPADFKYIRIYNETVGFQQGSLSLTFYNSKWNKINLDYQFTPEEVDKFGGEEMLSDYIHNTIVGMNHDIDIDWKECDEFFNKIQKDTEYYYEYI